MFSPIEYIRRLGVTFDEQVRRLSSGDLRNRIALLGDIPEPDGLYGALQEEARSVYRSSAAFGRVDPLVGRPVYDHGVLTRSVQCGRYRFEVRREPWPPGWDFVLCFAGRRRAYYSRLNLAIRAARLWARLMG